jgi:hypothetical protein
MDKFRWEFSLQQGSITFFFGAEKLREKKTESLYLRDIWKHNKLLGIVKQEPYKRNKVILTLLSNLNARSHKITLLKLKDIRLRDKYGEGKIHSQAKTRTEPVLLSLFFPFIRTKRELVIDLLDNSPKIIYTS